MMKQEERIKSYEAAYLKNAGEKIDVKVRVIQGVDGRTEIHIRDMVLYDCKKALEYLRHIAETELVGVSTENEEESQS